MEFTLSGGKLNQRRIQSFQTRVPRDSHDGPDLHLRTCSRASCRYYCGKFSIISRSAFCCNFYTRPTRMASLHFLIPCQPTYDLSFLSPNPISPHSAGNRKSYSFADIHGRMSLSPEVDGIKFRDKILLTWPSPEPAKCSPTNGE